MEDVKQIVVQNSFFGEPKTAFAMVGINPETLEKNKVNYDDLSDNEKELWDSFIELIKSKI